MAPTGNKLLLSTEQRYNVDNVHAGGSSESLLGYYMRDDNWNKTDGYWTFADDASRRICQDTMIWCGGWDDDFLQVPVKNNVDTVYYCLRARSVKTEDPSKDEYEEGDYFFNICRYKVCYHNPNDYGPKLELNIKGVTKALINNDEIEQKYDVLERLNFDYNAPGLNYTVYPHPLPWADASYGYTYPETSDLPHNRRHKETDFPNHGEYGTRWSSTVVPKTDT